MCMIYFHNKFHILNSNSLLFIALKPKAKYRFHSAVLHFSKERFNINKQETLHINHSAGTTRNITTLH
jgi:hypothetical protein